MRRGLDLVKRRSGGGAVVVAPSAQVWIDLFVPRDDPLHEDDVGRAADWVGDLWTAVLGADAGAAKSVQPVRRFAPTRFSRSVCFSGLGPGEVTVDGKKVVGVSQRRGRSGAWFFAMALRENAQSILSELLVLNEEDRRALASELDTQVGSVLASPDVLENAIASSLLGRA